MYVSAHRLSGMLSMIVMKHVLAMIVMNIYMHICSCFHGLSSMLCAMLIVNACYDCRT